MYFKQKALDADPKSIHQIGFLGIGGGDDNTKTRLYNIGQQLKKTVLEFCKHTTKVLWIV